MREPAHVRLELDVNDVLCVLMPFVNSSRLRMAGALAIADRTDITAVAIVIYHIGMRRRHGSNGCYNSRSERGITGGQVRRDKPVSIWPAFGSNETPKSSAFFKKPDKTPPPVSAFGQISTTPKTPVSGTASPAFGSTSALGGPKSMFPPARSIETTPTKAPAVGGFGAFSGAPTGFSAFAGPKTSFTDLLKSKGDKAADPIKPAALPVFSKPEAEGSKASVSVFAALTATPNQDKPAVGLAFTPISKETDKGEASTSGSKEDDKKISKSIPSEPSYGNLSLSASSSGSFVEVNANQDGSEELEEGEVSDEGGEHSDFLSDNYDESSYKR
ncbi:hypothetical protein CVT25_002455 [Psilocybe cyanescens]|uniref:Uncharacterized protein n=1 Tax=Psilocybe cyanescens TaxID=93625 RepID=A0A409X6L3_PSICY|nr:hypothetical protein CVT25_002455 [Psilocybe cyanescens]